MAINVVKPLFSRIENPCVGGSIPPQATRFNAAVRKDCGVFVCGASEMTRTQLQTTGRASLEHAIARACDSYDEARHRLRLGLAHQAHSFAHVVKHTLSKQMGDSALMIERQ